jgi:hypothetical protein
VDGYLAFKAGDSINVAEVINANWAAGYTADTSVPGLFPLTYVDFNTISDGDQGTSTAMAALQLSKKDRASAVERLRVEFNQHLIAGISDGGVRSHITDWVTTRLGQYDEEAVSEAVQYTAKKFAMQLSFSFKQDLDDGLQIAMGASWRQQLSAKPLKTKTDYVEFLHGFVAKHLYMFYSTDSKAVEKVATKAAEAVVKELKIAPQLLSGVAQLALYDFVFLCGMLRFADAERDLI